MKRKEARESAFLLLFEGVARADADPREIFETAKAERDLQTDDYAETVFFGVYDHLQEIDEKINACLIGWSRSRVSLVTLAITRLAAYEMMYLTDVPHKVSINEGIELSKAYDDDKTYAFVNGVLNALAKSCGDGAENG